MSKKMLGFVVVAGVVLALGASAGAATTLLSDDFDNGDIATGGTQGGFDTWNNVNGGTITEIGTDVTLMAPGIGGYTHMGIESKTSIDTTAYSQLTATFEITSLTCNTQLHGFEVGIREPGASSIGGHIGDRPRAGLVMAFYKTSDNGAWMLQAGISDNGSKTTDRDILGNGSISGTTWATYASGFSITLTADATGWSMTAPGTGIADASGNWVNHDYDDIFSTASHATVLHWQRNTNAATAVVDSVTVAGVPEPGTLMLITLGAGFLMRKRARR